MSSYFKPLESPSPVLIRNARFILTEKGVVHKKSVLIKDRRIIEIDKEDPIKRKFGRPEEVIDASKCLVMPGLINTHSHIAMSLFRGYAEELRLLDWLENKIWPAEKKLKPWHIEIGAALSVAEMLLSGTTSVVSMYFYNKSGSEADAVNNLGMRGALSHGIVEWAREKDIVKTKEFVRTWHGKDKGRIRIETAPHAPYTCSPDLLKEIEEVRADLNTSHGREYRILNTIHTAESKEETKEIKKNFGVTATKGVATYLKSLQALTKETIAAHCIHLTENDFNSFKSSGASISSCPVSNLKIGMGVADLPKAISHGINVSLGTDGPASNNSLDMFETMKLSSLLQKGIRNDATLMKARHTLELATIAGAKALHQEKEIGSIRVGKRADLVVLQLSEMHSTPIFDPYSHIIYSAKSSDVRDVLIDGRIIVRNREVLSLNKTELLDNFNEVTSELNLK